MSALVTNRWVDFWESNNPMRSLDYPFMVVELRLDAKGTGDGKLTAAAKLAFQPATKQIILENYGTQPVRLTNVRPLK